MPDTVTMPRRHQDALAVLSATRGVLTRGWVQRTWYEVETPVVRRLRFLPVRVDRSRVVGACLVGAVVHGAWLLSPRPEYAYPAIDALWHTLFDVSGLGVSGSSGEADPVGPMTAPLVRAARVRDLTTWNDHDCRTGAEVLALVDRSAERIAARHRRPSWEGRALLDAG